MSVVSPCLPMDILSHNMPTLSSLTIFFPSLNDARALPELVTKADQVARRVTNRYEILVINDGSTDNTADVLVALQKRFSRLRVITHSLNKGYGAALKSGFKHAKFDWIFYTDGDGQYDPTELTHLVRLVTPQVDVVNGYKKRRADSWIRVIVGDIYNRYAHRVARLPIRDVDCDFRLIRRSVLSNITLVNDSGAICMELIAKLSACGAQFAECAVHHYPRRFGHSEFFRISHLLATLHSLTQRGF